MGPYVVCPGGGGSPQGGRSKRLVRLSLQRGNSPALVFAPNTSFPEHISCLALVTTLLENISLLYNFQVISVTRKLLALDILFSHSHWLEMVTTAAAYLVPETGARC